MRPRRPKTIDLSGKYVMPGIINLHGHLGATVGLDQSADNLDGRKHREESEDIRVVWRHDRTQHGDG